MIYTVACYFDVDTEKYNPPMMFPFDKEAVVETLKEGAIKGRIEGAESFDVYCLGTYDTETAKFNLLEKPEKLLQLKDFVKAKATA